MYYEVKSKISRTLVQLTRNFFNETKRTATKCEGLDKKRRIIRSLSKFYWLSSSALKSVYFHQFVCLLSLQTVSDVGP